MKNVELFKQTNDPRIELHEKLNLTGAEISINQMPKGANVPFVHYHKENEEIYHILEGNGYFLVDDEKLNFEAGDWIKINPQVKRQLFALSDIKYVCIQVKQNSLTQYTQTDAVIL